MLHDPDGQTVVEYIIAVSLFVLLIGPVLYALYLSISGKLGAINVQIGS